MLQSKKGVKAIGGGTRKGERAGTVVDAGTMEAYIVKVALED